MHHAFLGFGIVTMLSTVVDVCFHQHRINDSTVLSSSDSRKNKSIAVAVVGSITVYILAWSDSRFTQGIAKLRKMCSQVLVISVLYCLA